MERAPHSDEHDLYCEHNRKLVGVLCKRFRLDRNDAVDVAQFAWLKFLEKQPARSNVFGWLYTTAKHEVYRRSRRGQREEIVEDSPELAYEPELADELDRSEVTRLLRSAMRDVLTDNQRAALTLWAQGYRYKEIAERLGKTYTWTNRHISEGLCALRRALGREPSR
jgi:RNA polymerase sigma factor (sigma-70 family)